MEHTNQQPVRIREVGFSRKLPQMSATLNTEPINTIYDLKSPLQTLTYLRLRKTIRFNMQMPNDPIPNQWKSNRIQIKITQIR